jgi:hypothetical protein
LSEKLCINKKLKLNATVDFGGNHICACQMGFAGGALLATPEPDSTTLIPGVASWGDGQRLSTGGGEPALILAVAPFVNVWSLVVFIFNEEEQKKQHFVKVPFLPWPGWLVGAQGAGVL